MSVRSRGFGLVAVAIAVAVLSLSTAAGGAAKKKTTIWAPTLHGLQKQVLLTADLLYPMKGKIEDPSGCFVFVAGKRVTFTFSFTPRKDQPGAQVRLDTLNAKPSRSAWRRDLKRGKKLTLSWTEQPRLGKHVVDAIKVSVYNSHGIHITSRAPARWYLYKAGTGGATGCIKSHASK